MKEFLPEGHSAASFRTAHPFSLHMLEQAAAKGVLLEAPVVLCDNHMNLHLSLGEIRGIIPRDEVCYSPTGETPKDIAILTRVGKSVCFYVREIEKRDGTLTAILSRKAAQKECYEKYISKLQPGDVIEAKVTHLEGFGAFLDVGRGIASLLPIDAISVSRISHPSLRFSVGDECRVIVKSKDEAGRIYVTRKELLGTWEQNASLFQVGQTVAGTVRGIEPYGVFVELTPNLTGLAELKDGVRENETASVFIKSILPDRMKIKLVIIDSCAGVTQQGTLCRFPESAVSHIDRWQYSPECSAKRIETVFDE